MKNFLKKNQIRWEYEAYHFPVGDRKWYTPDFYLPEHGVFCETKGGWGVGSKQKLDMFLRQYDPVPVVVVHWLLANEVYETDSDSCVIR